MSYVYNGKFTGNILTVGRTGCGKTAFVQKLAINKFFGELVKAEWVSYIKLDKQREAELQSCLDCLKIIWNISKINLIPLNQTIPILKKILAVIM